MKKILILFLLQFLAPAFTSAEILEELWEKYAPEDFREERQLPTPGIVYGQPAGTGESSFFYQWQYRPKTYEMHFQDPVKLASGLRSLALFTHDISPELDPEKFYKGVTGFHYSTRQIADWLNHSLATRQTLNQAENEFAGELLKNGVVTISSTGFAPGAKINHVLGAAPGKKRSFAQNLLHERLHVFWDENNQMRQTAHAAWKNLTESEKEAIRKRLKNYDQNNGEQLLEEWAIMEAEKNGFKLK